MAAPIPIQGRKSLPASTFGAHRDSGREHTTATTDVLTFDLSVEIRRPPAAVFALLSDIQDFEPIPRDTVVKTVKEPSGPTAVRTRRHEKVELAPFVWLHVENLVSEVDAPHLLAIDAHSSWMTAHLTYRIEPLGDGCVLRQHENLRLRVAAMARPVRRTRPAPTSAPAAQRHQDDSGRAVRLTSDPRPRVHEVLDRRWELGEGLVQQPW